MYEFQINIVIYKELLFQKENRSFHKNIANYCHLIKIAWPLIKLIVDTKLDCIPNPVLET